MIILGNGAIQLIRRIINLLIVVISIIFIVLVVQCIHSCVVPLRKLTWTHTFNPYLLLLVYFFGATLRLCRHRTHVFPFPSLVRVGLCSSDIK